ncbi:hypothetical protein Hthe01_18590 [Hydrogenophilus thermoluteolus]|nr:hypothetical protein Hthe01_18590 [Hydrogenophilus thermoluteolus]
MGAIVSFWSMKTGSPANAGVGASMRLSSLVRIWLPRVCGGGRFVDLGTLKTLVVPPAHAGVSG